MFDLRITSFNEFRIFVKLIRNEQITEEEIAKLLPSFEESTRKLIEAELNAKKV